MTFQQWFNEAWYSNCVTIISIIVSGIISLIISDVYYRKGNRNNLKMNVIYPIIRLSEEKYSEENYKKLCEISKDYSSRYLKKNEIVCLMKFLSAYKKVCRYNDESVNANILFSYFEDKLKKININPKSMPVECQGEYVAATYPDNIDNLLFEDLKKVLEETPYELKIEECEEKISSLYNLYCAKYYGVGPLQYFDDFSINKVLKKSDIHIEWDKKFGEVQTAKKQFLNLKIARQ